MNRKLAVVGGAAITLAFSSGLVAEAAIVTIGDQEFNVTTVTGSYYELQPLLIVQPWWTPSPSQIFPDEAASQVGAKLGFPNSDTSVQRGPLFALDNIFGVNDEETVDASFWQVIGGVESLGRSEEFAGSDVFTYAIIDEATPVPEPATILGSLAAIGFGSLMKRRLLPN